MRNFTEYILNNFKPNSESRIGIEAQIEITIQLLYTINRYFAMIHDDPEVRLIFDTVHESIVNQDCLLLGFSQMSHIGTKITLVPHQFSFFVPTYLYRVDFYLPLGFYAQYCQDYIRSVGNIAYHYFIARALVDHIKIYSGSSRPGDFDSLFHHLSAEAEAVEFRVIDSLYSQNPDYPKCQHHQNLYDKFDLVQTN